ncbi:hypothetical protein AB0F88_07015 [Streptosporangium sp. NPDC023963]|uniref:hypothetical protein n=1 Tax=Streptosporangium sp. NPDC023963 TaxID=3155608 RepID=UPI003428F242
MNRTSKVTRALLVAALAAGLSACSGGSAAPGASGVSVTATATVTVSVSPSPAASAAPSPSSTPSPSASASAGDDALVTASPSVSLSGSRDVDATTRGQIALRGVDGITVTSESDQEVKALLLPYTVVRDARGLVCKEGEAPYSCSVEQLQKAIEKRGALFAKVTIKDGVAVQIEDITEE